MTNESEDTAIAAAEVRELFAQYRVSVGVERSYTRWLGRAEGFLFGVFCSGAITLLSFVVARM